MPKGHKSQNIKQKQYCTKFNKDFKNGQHPKNLKKKTSKRLCFSFTKLTKDDHKWVSSIALPTQCTWIWANSRRQWRTEEPGVHGVAKSWTWLSEWITTNHHSWCWWAGKFKMLVRVVIVSVPPPRISEPRRRVWLGSPYPCVYRFKSYKQS